MSEQGVLAAGDFSSWMIAIRDAIRGERASDVPCDGCTACCTSFQFIHIGPDESGTLAHIPPKLLFPAPLAPRGHVLLGYDEQGHCPMLIDNRCSIYEHCPRTCRTYDCRVFPAAGLSVEDDKILIARRAQRWRFSFSSEAGRTQQAAIQAAATFIREHPQSLPAEAVPVNATQLAVLAIQIHELFLRREEECGQTAVVNPDPGTVRAEVLSFRGGPEPRQRANASGRRRR